MATLVLTTVGGAFGGPVGAALGAVLGNQIDRAVLLPRAMRTGPRLTDLAVQTSRYGEQIPRVFGTMRVAGTVIWSTDLIETRATSRGGKGQPSTTTYSYTASFAVALSARRAIEVRRIWADGKLLRGAAGDWKNRVGAFRLHPGDERQVPDPLIASANGAVPAHRGVAYAVFEQLQLADFGNRIPSLTFELVADAGAVTIGTIARDLGGEAGLQSAVTTSVDGYAASGSSAAGALATLARIAGAQVVPGGGGGLMLARAGSPTATLTDDLETTWTRAPADTVPRTLSVSHYEPSRDYQLGVQTARRPAPGWRDEAVEAPVVLSAAAARGLAEQLLQVAEAEAERVRVTASIETIGLAPGNAIALPGDPRRWRVERAAVEDGGVTLDLVPLCASIAPVIADAGAPPPVSDAPAGATWVEAFELPPLTDILPTVPQLMVAACGTGAGWRGAALALSGDGATWTEAGASAAPAVIGRLSVPLAPAGALLRDEANAVELILAQDAMTLLSADAAAIDRGANLALIGDELMQFQRAEPLGKARWRLTRLWRGRRGTAVAAWPAGARFVLIEADALAVLPMAGHAPGERIRVLASGIGDEAVTEMTLDGSSIAPPSPVHLRATRQADGSVAVRWVRRSRLGWRWSDGVDVPLVEERELYRATLLGPAGVRRVATVDAPVLTLSAGEVADGPVTLELVQLGTLAPSRGATITIGGE